MKLFRPWFLGFCSLLALSTLRADTVTAYIGTLTVGTASRGIYSIRFDQETGACSAPVLAADSRNPSWVTVAPGGRFLYTAENYRANEKFTPDMVTDQTSISAYRIGEGGSLTLINRRLFGKHGSSVPHLLVDATGRMLVAVNYGGNGVAAFPLAADGSIGPLSASDEPKGPKGPVTARQEAAHPHGLAFSPDNRFALVCDLGLDRVLDYRIDPARAGLKPNQPAFAQLAPGTGPRHLAFAGDGRFVYVADELGDRVSVFSYRKSSGGLDLIQELSPFPPGFSAVSYPAEVVVHPNDRFVYLCNRGPASDSISVFARDSRSGKLHLLQNIPCGGHYPRSFTLSPNGRWLLAANQHSANVSVLKLDPETGRLTATKSGFSLDVPVCLAFRR